MNKGSKLGDTMRSATPLKRTRRNSDEAFSLLREIAGNRGLTLLTEQWNGAQFAYLFCCASGHEFTRIGTVAMRGTVSCLECERSRVERRFLETLAERGITCREGRFLGQNARQHFRCREGHEWATQARKILEGSGCPSCALAYRTEQLIDSNGLARLQEAAAARGGRCLTDAYLGIKENYLWECANGHRWQARGYSVVKGGWCWPCFARRNGDAHLKPERLSDIHARALSHGGQCLDETYHGSNSKYRFRCARGHEWLGWGHQVLGGAWCRRCANLDKRLTIEEMQAVAKARGGRCLSAEYLGHKFKLTWECHLGHVWSSTPGTVVNRGAWCPNCFRLRITRDPTLRRRYDRDG
ncbi:hypothetical protein [Burkholderia pseudomallei]|uniref:hypothetical protein n=1 Tax=Burkholderia pseudomallei TaxID=28450 RepID=UPI001FCBB65C|nr:hypothetical protein [Burkholderia pseudomallei]